MLRFVSHIRLFPILVVCFLLILVLKLGSIVREEEIIARVSRPQNPIAADSVYQQADAGGEAIEDDDITLPERKPARSRLYTNSENEITQLADLMPSAGEEGSSKEGEEDAQNDESAEGDGSADGKEPPAAQQLFSQAEIDILKKLSDRRKLLEAWEEELEMKERVLRVAELRVEEKIKAMRVLKDELETLIKEYKKEDNQKIRRLVRIYENMKPKDAAKIFSQMDMPTLLEVSAAMREKNLALVLAQMDPKLANDLTSRLVERRRLKED